MMAADAPMMPKKLEYTGVSELSEDILINFGGGYLSLKDPTLLEAY